MFEDQLYLTILWVAASIVIGVAGQKRECGGIPVALLSLLLSPICGMIALFTSEKNDVLKHRQFVECNLRSQQLIAEITATTQIIAAFREKNSSDSISEEQRQKIITDAWAKLQHARECLAKLD